MLAAGATCGPNITDTTSFVLGLHPVSASSSFLALRRLSYNVPDKHWQHGSTSKGVSLQGSHVSALYSLEHHSLAIHKTKVGSYLVHQCDQWRSKSSSHARSHPKNVQLGGGRLWWPVEQDSVPRLHGQKIVTCSAKKSAKNGGNEETTGKQSAPPRVSTNINIPVRYQLRYVKALKEYQKGAHGPPVRQTTGYRKKKERTSEGSGDVVAPSTSLMGQGVMEDLNIDPPVLLVDGYNMCGYWPKLKKHFAKGDLEAARSKLIVELQAYGAVKGIRVVVVFDAQKSGLTSHSEGDKYVEVVFSADDTADSWIESEAQSLRDQGNHNVWVVTSDLAQQSMAYGLGATVWSCGLLIQEINQARKDMLKQLEEDKFIGDLSARQPTFEEAVSRDSFDKLANLYERLSRAEDGLSDGDDDVSTWDDDVSSPGDDVSIHGDRVSSRKDDVSGRYGSDGDDFSDAYASDESDHDVSGYLDPGADDVSSWKEQTEGESVGKNESEGVFASQPGDHGDERRATGAHAETSGRSDAHDAAAVRAIPVAFGKGRVDLGAAVKRRRQSGGGYSSGSDSDGPPQRVPPRKRAHDLDIFQRFDTLPDFGYGTGDDDHRGRMHRGWREVERAVEDGKVRGAKNGSNEKSRGVNAGAAGASRGLAYGTERAANGRSGTGNGTNGTVNGTIRRLNGTSGTVGGAQNGTNGKAGLNDGRGAQDNLKNGADSMGSGSNEYKGSGASWEHGVSGNGRVADNGSGDGLGKNGLGTSTRDVPANGNGRLENNGDGRSSSVGLARGHLGHEESVESTGQVQGDAGLSPVIRGPTKRVPGQSNRVVKTRDKEAEHAVGDDNGERMNVAHRGSNGWAKQGSGIGVENGVKNGSLAHVTGRVGGNAGHWDLMADPRLMRSPLVQPNGAIVGQSNASVEGNKRNSNGSSSTGNGLSGRKALQSRSTSGEEEVERGGYEDSDGTPFDDLTTEQMLALKYGHASRPGSENLARSNTRHTNKVEREKTLNT